MQMNCQSLSACIYRKSVSQLLNAADRAENVTFVCGVGRDLTSSHPYQPTISVSFAGVMNCISFLFCVKCHQLTNICYGEKEKFFLPLFAKKQEVFFFCQKEELLSVTSTLYISPGEENQVAFLWEGGGNKSLFQ